MAIQPYSDESVSWAVGADKPFSHAVGWMLFCFRAQLSITSVMLVALLLFVLLLLLLPVDPALIWIPIF